MTTSVLRTDVQPPKGLKLDNPGAESIVGVMVLTLSEYSLTATVQGQLPQPDDIGAVMAKFLAEHEYSNAFASKDGKAK